MVEKLVLAYIHDRLCEWRHDVMCTTAALQRPPVPFGGVKVVLAEDFGQVPPVTSNPTQGRCRQDNWARK